MFPDFQKREYGRECWWFERVPNPDDIQEEENINALVDKLVQRFRAEKDQALQKCPKVDKTTAYARDKLDIDEGNEIREHIHSCRNCLNVFLNIKLNKIYVEKKEVEDTVHHQRFDGAILKASQTARIPQREATYSNTSFSQVKNGINRFLRSIFSPKWITAAALTGSLFLFIYFFNIYNSHIKPSYKFDFSTSLQSSMSSIYKDSSEVPHLLYATVTKTDPSGMSDSNISERETEIAIGDVISSNDVFNIKILLEEDAFIYIIKHHSTDGFATIFSGKIISGLEVTLPEDEIGYRAGIDEGEITLFCIASKEPIKEFHSRLRKLNGPNKRELIKIFPATSIGEFYFSINS
jgi:hypothetical protein